jgi:transposase
MLGKAKEPTKNVLKKVEHILLKSVKMELTRNHERRQNMLYNHFTEKLLGLQDVIITNIEEDEKNIRIFCEIKRKEHHCISCGTATNTIHDYRMQTIKDIPAFGKLVTIVLRKRRYRCPHCGKRFFENNSFLPKYHRMTNRLSAYVINKLRCECSFTSVAREVNLSVSTVIRIFDLVSYSNFKLPSALSIDEFKGNTNGEKYQCILTDPVNKVVLDILPKRYDYYLADYFKRFTKEERSGVKYFVSDMWKTYFDASDTWFKNATKIVDKYHWIRQVIWAFEAVRKQEQKKFSKTHRIYFKRSKSLLIKQFKYLSDEQKQQVNVMLYASPTLSSAYFIKEKFLKILDCKDRDSAKQAMAKWIENAEHCGIPQFEKCARTMSNWITGILNSFSAPITNGFTEGCNNKIKVLKRNAYGYRNFKRFRNRILHMFSHQNLKIKQVAV